MRRSAVVLAVLAAAVAFPKQPGSDIPVTSYLADLDATFTPYYIQSDSRGAYPNGVNDVTSILVGNGYNQIVDGDWRLDLWGSAVRTMAITFSASNAVQPGGSGYQAPANPPYWGTEYQAAHMENKCTQDRHDMLTMKPGDSFQCSTFIRFPAANSGYYRLYMATSYYSETNDVQVHCNSADSGGCNDWFIDPVPIVNPDGSTSPGKARARLNFFGFRNQVTDDGDFYLTFHIHVTRP